MSSSQNQEMPMFRPPTTQSAQEFIKLGKIEKIEKNWEQIQNFGIMLRKCRKMRDSGTRNFNYNGKSRQF